MSRNYEKMKKTQHKIEELVNTYASDLGIIITSPKAVNKNPFEFRDIIEQVLEKNKDLLELEEENPSLYRQIINRVAAAEYQDIIALYFKGEIIIPESNNSSVDDRILAHELFHAYQDQKFDILAYETPWKGELTQRDILRHLVCEGSAEYMARTILGENLIGLSEITSEIGLDRQPENAQELLKILAETDYDLILQKGSTIGCYLVNELTAQKTIDDINRNPPNSFKEVLPYS